MLEMGGAGTVRGPDRPVIVGIGVHPCCAEVEHRFDADDHAGHQLCAAPEADEIRHFRRYFFAVISTA